MIQAGIDLIRVTSEKETMQQRAWSFQKYCDKLDKLVSRYHEPVI